MYPENNTWLPSETERFMIREATKLMARYITAYQKKILKEPNRPGKNSPAGNFSGLDGWPAVLSE